MSDSLWPHWLQHTRLSCSSPCPKVCSDWCPLSWWCHPTISSSPTPLSSSLQSSPASGAFLVSQLFASGGQTIGSSASVLPMNIQDWFPLGLTGLISLLSKGLSRVFFHTTVQRHQFFSLLYGTTLTTIHDYWKNHSFDYTALCQQSDVSAFNMLSRFVIAFLPKGKCLLISWLKSLSTVILELKKIKSVTASTFAPSICHEVMRPDAMILVFWMLSFKPVFSFPFFTLMKKFFSRLSISAIRVVSSAFLRLLLFLLAILIPACDSSSLAFHMMCSA